MKLRVLGSGSKGNCYCLTDTKGQSLMLECGLTIAKIKKGMNHDLSGVVGVLITHEHGDHSKAAKHLVKDGLYVYSSEGTATALELKESFRLAHGNITRMGDYTIIPFNVHHDAVEPLGFHINHPEMGNLLFMTDTTKVNYRFDNITHYLIEANHSFDVIKTRYMKGEIHEYLANRVVSQHLSLEKAIETISENDRTNLKTITLCHLSDENSQEKMFIERVASKFALNPVIARKYVEIDLSLSW